MQQVLIARLPQPEMILTGGKREVQHLSFSSFPDWHRPAPESQRWAQPYVGVVHCYRGISVLPYHLRWLCGLHGGAIQQGISAHYRREYCSSRESLFVQRE